MKPLRELGAEEASGLRGLLFDLDDTLLTHGSLTRAAYDALWALKDAGLALVAVTGRPAGWARVLARQWPVAGCIAENGAVYVVRDGPGVACRTMSSDAELREGRQRLARLVERVRQVVPEAKLTDDNDLRVSDVTWDVGERERLPEGRAREVVREIERAGARWTQSSVHLHATFDPNDKASGAVHFCRVELGQESGAALARFAFVGDSGNDAACFAAFRTTFGVANVRAHVARLSVPPRYVASAAMGEGFAETAAAILARRAPASAAAC